MLVSEIQFCPSAPLINELECISLLVPSFGPSMDRVVAAFSTKQRLLRGAGTRGEDNFILATLINCAQTARCLLGILQGSLLKEETMAKQAADHHREAAKHPEKARTLPTSRMALTNRRSIMGLTRRSPMSNIMGSM